MSEFRSVLKVIRGMDTEDGGGVRLKRIIGSPDVNQFDPFLLLDEFKNDDPSGYVAGFPPHPHRGFETVTYMLSGNFTHRDSKGNEGHLGSGSVQWMTAGKGIIHSEMPAQDKGLVWGYQLWLNLPARLKKIEPRYQDIPAERIPEARLKGGTAKIIAGTLGAATGPGEAHYPVTFFDISLEPGALFEHAVPRNQNSICYVYEGSANLGREFEAREVTAGHLALFADDGDLVRIKAGRPGTRLLFLAAQKLNEAVVRGGPFVMNTREELMQAFQDYQNGVLDA